MFISVRRLQRIKHTIFKCSVSLPVISLYFLCCSVNGSVCFVCFVFVNCLVKQSAISLGVVVILLLNVMEMLSMGEAVG